MKDERMMIDTLIAQNHAILSMRDKMNERYADQDERFSELEERLRRMETRLCRLMLAVGVEPNIR